MSQARSSGAQFLLEASVWSVLWRLATPNVVAVATMTAVTFADAYYVGQLGTTSLASLALVFPFLSMMQMMAGGAIGGGTTSAVARAFGAGDMVWAEVTAWHAVLIALLISGLLMIALGLFARPVFELSGGEGAVLAGAIDYARIIFGGASATLLIFVTSAIYRGLGDTVTPARSITTASLIQIVLSGGLTLGWFGLPALGIAGAAVAWVTCQGAAAAYLAISLFRGRGEFRLRPHALKWEAIKDIMAVSGLGLLHSFCLAMTVAVVTGYVGQYGTKALAGYGLGARLELMLVPIAFGVGAALTAAVGVNVGANQYARARRIAWAGGAVVMALTGLLGISVAMMPSLWLGLFTADPDAYAFGVQYLVIAAPFYGIFGLGQSFYFASQGTGRMVLPVAVTVLRFITVATLGAIVLALGWDLVWLFAVVAVGLIIMGIGQASCVLGPGWRGRLERNVTSAPAPEPRH
ncbi:MAG: MATE family efflux transporter [Pseudomonadota bacterium]